MLYYFHRAHAEELGNVVPTKPILFLKPTSSYITQGQSIKVNTYTVNMVIFAGGNFRENVAKTFNVGVIFTILLLLPS